MSEIQNYNTIFDDVFRTMVQKMPKLLIPLINEVFHTDYSENESFKQIVDIHIEKYHSEMMINDVFYNFYKE